MSFYWPNFFGKFCSICKAFKWAYLQLRAGIFKAQHQNLWGGKIQTLNCMQIIFFFKSVRSSSLNYAPQVFEFSISPRPQFHNSQLVQEYRCNWKQLMQQFVHDRAYPRPQVSLLTQVIFWYTFWESVTNENTDCIVHTGHTHISQTKGVHILR